MRDGAIANSVHVSQQRVQFGAVEFFGQQTKQAAHNSRAVQTCFALTRTAVCCAMQCNQACVQLGNRIKLIFKVTPPEVSHRLSEAAAGAPYITRQQEGVLL